MVKKLDAIKFYEIAESGNTVGNPLFIRSAANLNSGSTNAKAHINKINKKRGCNALCGGK